MKLGLLRDFAYEGFKKGGEGSGNFGHEGRPGEVGGSGEGGSASGGGFSDKEKKKIGSAMPSGSFRSSDGNTISWSKRGGYAGGNSIRTTTEKLKALGFSHKESSQSASPGTGEYVRTENVLADKHGNEFSWDTSYGETAASNSFYMKLVFKS